MTHVLLTVTMTGPDAPALGFLLHKHPDRVQTFHLSVGEATVFYPQSDPERVTAALVVEPDPIGMVKGRLRSSHGHSLTDSVTDRPYAASSMLSVAIGRVFTTALAGRCDARPEIAASPVPLEIRVPAVPVRPADGDLQGPDLVRALFAPLGWSVEAAQQPMGPDGGWGPAPYVDLTLTGTLRLADALSHLYVLLPVLDDSKHYWVGSDEVTEDTEEETSTPLRIRRRDAVTAVLGEIGAHRVVDMGCGEGFYLRALLDDPAITEVVGADVSPRALSIAEKRLNLDRMPERQRARLTLRQSSVTYRDDRLAGFDAILLIEVIEHLDPDRIASLEANILGFAHPGHLIVTTPNREYNRVYGLAPGTLRHRDHRFEWTRDQFGDWARAAAQAHGYTVEFRPVGDQDPKAGPPTQMAVFTRKEQ